MFSALAVLPTVLCNLYPIAKSLRPIRSGFLLALASIPSEKRDAIEAPEKIYQDSQQKNPTLDVNMRHLGCSFTIWTDGRLRETFHHEYVITLPQSFLSEAYPMKPAIENNNTISGGRIVADHLKFNDDNPKLVVSAPGVPHQA